MKMQTAILISFTDENGAQGLGLEIACRNVPRKLFAATSGEPIAHDLVEHVNGPLAIGEIDDELEALGAMWFVRGQFNDLRRDGVGSMHTPHEHIASDIALMFPQFAWGAEMNLRPARTRACDVDDDLREIIEIARSRALEEMRYEKIDHGPERLREYLLAALPRMRIGYRKAARRWRGNASAANAQFWAIADCVAKHARFVEIDGARLVLRYGNGLASCEELSDYDDE